MLCKHGNGVEGCYLCDNEEKGLFMSLGDRIKGYERAFNHTTVKRSPLMIRVDGKAFHTFTKGLEKPFDVCFMSAMVRAAVEVAREMQGFKVGYVQSDEATFCLTDYDNLNTQGWFGYEINKVVSISASLMTAWFNKLYPSNGCPVFDSRAFTVPKDDVVNAFLWRAQDWQRNSLQMYAHACFSHKQLHKKNREDMHEMLHSIGKNWTTDLSSRERNGTFIIATENGINCQSTILPAYESLNNAIGHLF